MRTSVRSSLAAMAIVLVALTSVAAPMASSASAGTSVPFAGSFNGAEVTTPNPPFPPSSLSVVGNWSGVATHLGRFTVESHHTVIIATRTAMGTFTFTAANGDTVTASFTGQATPTANPDVLSVVEFGTITGGTGRFAGATGSFTVRRLLAQGSTFGFFTGSISTH
jgi:hypothetical protein